jgi:hypothetical protein
MISNKSKIHYIHKKSKVNRNHKKSKNHINHKKAKNIKTRKYYFLGGNNVINLFINFANIKNILYETSDTIRPIEIIKNIVNEYLSINAKNNIKNKYGDISLESLFNIKTHNGLIIDKYEKFEFKNNQTFNIDFNPSVPLLIQKNNYDVLIDLLKKIKDDNKSEESRIILENYAVTNDIIKNIKQQFLLDCKPLHISYFIDIAYNNTDQVQQYNFWNLIEVNKVKNEYPDNILSIYEKPEGMKIEINKDILKNNNSNKIEYANKYIHELNNYANKNKINLEKIGMKFYIINYDVRYKDIKDIINQLDLNINLYNWDGSVYS